MSTPSLRNNTMFPILSLAVVVTVTLSAVLVRRVLVRDKTSTHLDDDDDDGTARDDAKEEPIHSILHHFASLQLDPETTVEEANKRRTATYYLKAREAHGRDNVVRGVPSYRRLTGLRRQHVARTLRYGHLQTHSHRTVVVMCDASTAASLDAARRDILAPLNPSHDVTTTSDGAWIPSLDMIPVTDMHVTVATPWWWHTMRDGNLELSRQLAARFRQTLFLKFHHPFQIELQRIVLLGGQTLVALWRCVGERVTEDGHVVYDRHGECVDPFVRLRVEIVRCFTQELAEHRLQPLTYQNVTKPQLQSDNATTTTTTTATSQSAAASSAPDTSASPPPPPPRPVELTREHSIERQTPGLGSGDGFIHTTLCRLPLDCLSQRDISLEHVHRLCREATSTMSGHRMVISKFRFLETTGRGGLSNPCVEPIFDETIEAPSRFKVRRNGRVNEIANLHVLPHVAGNSSTIGAIRKHISHRPGLSGLFDDPNRSNNDDDEDDAKADEIMSRGSIELVADEETNDSVRLEITAPVLI